MRYIELRQALKGFTVFSLSDIKRLDTTFYRRRLNEWQDKGYIKKLIRGFYVFSDLEPDENVLFEIANRIYSPSYVSFQTALSYYGLIPESAYGITSASTRRTYKFKTPIAEFSYQTLAAHLFFGYEIIKYGDRCFKIASVEKSLLDYFYINPKIKDEEDFMSLRIKKDILFSRINKRKLNIYLNRFAQKTLKKRIRVFWEVMKNA